VVRAPRVGAGETHAIVGATGAGKSTVVKLLLRLYDATGGRVAVDGVPVGELSFGSLRGEIGYVGQDTFLFDGTVADNLRYGAPDAGDAELRAAGELAEAHAFVADLPRGYDTAVGERGVRLSGGQRQRLTIARALVRNPSILVLDEATSAVDNETEAAIQRSLLRVSHQRTTIVISRSRGTHDAHGLYAVQTGEVAV
jgi:ATP-binding cassette subfamily B protein